MTAGLSHFAIAFAAVVSAAPRRCNIQVELCEIPFAGASEILRSEAYWQVRCNGDAAGGRF